MLVKITAISQWWIIFIHAGADVCDLKVPKVPNRQRVSDCRASCSKLYTSLKIYLGVNSMIIFPSSQKDVYVTKLPIQNPFCSDRKISQFRALPEWESGFHRGNIVKQSTSGHGCLPVASVCLINISRTKFNVKPASEGCQGYVAACVCM